MKTRPESPALSGIAPAAAAAAAESANLPVEHEDAPPPAGPFGARSYVLDDFEWVPVLRKPRADGWTPQRQVDFIAALADTGCVEEAAREVGMSARSCYRLRRSPGAEQFAAAWEAATAQAARRLVDIAFDRAIHGSNEPVFDKEGNRVGRRMRQNDRLLMFLLRAYMPERFRHAHQDVRHAGAPPPALSPPVAEALGTLAPQAPDDAHLLMPAEELETALLCAEIMDGELPHWRRRRGDDSEPVPSRDEDLERRLAEARQAAAPLRCEDPDAFTDRQRGRRRREAAILA